jgi:N-acetylmuramoyl-L-alanine amidase
VTQTHTTRILTTTLLLAAAIAHAQTPHATIILDPAHGGADSGAHLADAILEKNVNLALATRLRTTLAAQGFTVVLTRETEPDDAPATSPDQRAEIANHARPLACLILHASTSGHGVHFFTSSLIPLTMIDEPRAVLEWNTAQAASIPQSLRLVNELSAAFNSARIPLVVGRGSIKPIDSLVCPAIAIEVSPLLVDAATSTSAADETYQQNVVEAIASGLISWRKHVEEAAADKQAESAPKSTPAKPKPASPKPAPKTGDAQ